MRLTELDLDNIEGAAEGKLRETPVPFSHPADTLKLVAEVRRLRAELASRYLKAAEGVDQVVSSRKGAGKRSKSI